MTHEQTIVGLQRDVNETLAAALDIVRHYKVFDPRGFILAHMLSFGAELAITGPGTTDTQREAFIEEMRKSLFRIEQHALAGEPVKVVEIL